MDAGAIAVLVTAVTGFVCGGVGLLRSGRSDERTQIGQLWDENRKLRAEMSDLYDEVVGLRTDVARCENEKRNQAAQILALQRAQ